MTAKSKKQGGFGMRPCLAVLAALLTLISCRKDADKSMIDGVCVVSFSASGTMEVEPLTTKASVPLPEGVAVGVAAYERAAGGATPAPAQDIWKAANTYAVQAGGALVASLADGAGKPAAGSASEMELNSGTYDFYAYSPALKTEADKYTIKGIAHYTDFMGASVSGQAVSRTASRVDLQFEHKCSKVRFNVATASGMENSSLAAGKATLYKMAVSPAQDFVLGGDLVPTVGSETDICQLQQIEAAADAKSTSVWDVLLPKSNGSFDADFYLKINGIQYVLKAKGIPAMSFGKGIQYIFNAVVRQGDVNLVLNVASWDAVPEDVNTGEGGGIGSGSWGEGDGEAGGTVGTDHGIVIGRWENVDWIGSIGSNPDPVTGALEVGSWTPVQVPVDAGGNSVADIDTWVRKTLAAQAGDDHGGAVGDWNGNEFAANMGGLQYDMSNCAMIVPGSGDEGAVTFDIRKCLANTFTTESDLHTMLTNKAWRVEVLWQDVRAANYVTVSYNVLGVADDKTLGLFTVKSNNATTGNAVVALYNNATSGGTILWSWHIWVTDYRPDEAGVATRTENTAYTVTGGQVHTYGAEYQKANGTSCVIMDRNLGATKAYNTGAPAADDMTAQQAFGMFYQWGRKDPFPRGTNATVNITTATIKTIPIYNGTTTLAESVKGYTTAADVISGSNNLAYSVKNPLTFIGNTVAPSDWYATVEANQNKDLWGYGGPKSAYDPCPKGWRVPQKATWSDFTRTDASTGTFLHWSQGEQSEQSETASYLTNGRYYKPTTNDNGVRAWYPSMGFRDYGRTGYEKVVRSGGNVGMYWSSSIGTTGSFQLYFISSWLSDGGSEKGSNRAYGLQVRCIQD